VLAPPDSDQAHIATDPRLNCDSCSQCNARLFAYDNVNWVYFKDVKAGSYRELVEAEESCPVCIIYPGKPLDPGEPNLDESQKRAAFN
jgi:hypothetical protein